MCVCERAREILCVCVCVRDRERDCVCVRAGGRYVIKLLCGTVTFF